MTIEKVIGRGPKISVDVAIERVTFALEEPYAHGIVTLSTATAKAVLEHLRELEDLEKNMLRPAGIK